MQKFFNTKSDDLIITLPEPDRNGSVSLEEAISTRRSIREFSKKPVDITELSQILWSAQGSLGEEIGRTAPSAGGTYPIEVYALVMRVNDVKPGIYLYKPENHTLKLVKRGKFAKLLKQAALSQESIELAPLNIIIAARFQRTESRYGSRAKRYVYMECGHVGQNVQLEACSLGMGSVIVGAFRDDEAKQVLGIDEEVLYIIPTGKKRVNNEKAV
ncbi:SagB/ThcOx family dehydrogenase [bacterium]|nr:SagB/ThcOx family dehydrogenase [bacterium]